VNPVERRRPQFSPSEGERGVIVVEAVEVEGSGGGLSSYREFIFIFF
jgi:hypothetical protein